MVRHEAWRRHYRNNRDLDHLSPSSLSERYFDCLNNFRVRDEQGKMGFLPVDEGEHWMVWMTEIMEECALRGYDYPGPINISGFGEALEHAFIPIPNMEEALRKFGYGTRLNLLRFGETRWLKKARESGEFLLSPGSYYESATNNHARRDPELTRVLTPNPRDPKIAPFLTARGISQPVGKVVGEITIREPGDYYLFSSSWFYSSRLFGDFNADACLIIHQPEIFMQRFAAALGERLRDGEVRWESVSYFDSVRCDPANIDVRFWKPHRHAYQKELRLTWTPTQETEALDRITIELGSLEDCTDLVTLRPTE